MAGGWSPERVPIGAEWVVGSFECGMGYRRYGRFLERGALKRGTSMGDCRYRGPQWIRRGTGKPHLVDGSVVTLDPEFDWPDETWIAFHFETHCSIGTDPYDSRPLFEPTSAA